MTDARVPTPAPFKHNIGGWPKAGPSIVVNHTGRAIPVRTEAEWDAISKAAIQELWTHDIDLIMEGVERLSSERAPERVAAMADSARASAQRAREIRQQWGQCNGTAEGIKKIDRLKPLYYEALLEAEACRARISRSK